MHNFQRKFLIIALSISAFLWGDIYNDKLIIIKIFEHAEALKRGNVMTVSA